VNVEDLVAAIESRGEEIVTAQKSQDDQWVVITKPMLRVITNFATETR